MPNLDGRQDPRVMKKANIWTTIIAFEMGTFVLFEGRQRLKELVNYLSLQSFLNFNYKKLILYFSINRI